MKKDEGRVISDYAVSAMLTAIQNFIKESFKGDVDSVDSLQELRHGKLRILIEHGKSLYIAAVTSGKTPPKMRTEMREIISKIYEIYGERLEDWDGNLTELKKINRLVEPLIKE